MINERQAWGFHGWLDRCLISMETEGRMEVTYRKNLSRSYMCVEEHEQPLEMYELQMLENRSIPGLLQLQTVISEGKRRYMYDISGKQQIGDYFAGKKIGYETLQQFLFSVHKVCAGLSEYLLREEGLCLELEFIYVNLEDGSLQFTYLPFYDKNLQEAFERCLEQLLRKLDHQDKEAVELGYQVYQLCTRGNVNIGKLLETALGAKLLPIKEEALAETGNGKWEGTAESDENRGAGDDILGKQADNMENLHTVAWQEKLGSCMAQSKLPIGKYLSGFYRAYACIAEKIDKNRHKIGQKKTAVSNKVKKRRDKEEMSAAITKSGKEVGMKPVDEPDMPPHPTEILGVRLKEPLGKLVYKGVHSCEDIQIEGEEFLVGKNSEQVSGVVLAEGISRLHARITHQGDKYFIEDLNSTNGTYVNDIALEYHQPHELNLEDRIRFGVEEYIFL